MLFNSYQFILLFLPITFLVYFFLNRKKLTIFSKSWLVAASLFFYGWWNLRYLPLIMGSILFNYAVGTTLERAKTGRRGILITGIVGNLALLGYFKYADFFIENVNSFTGSHLSLLHIILPLGISFFTFTQIAFLVDAYKGSVKEYDLLNYSLFVTFFPHLLAGPIIHHKEMMPQFKRTRNKVFNSRNISLGIFLFAMGLFKKVVIADEFALIANKGFDTAQVLTFLEAWVTSLSYTLQIYFDFSGYTDMALGSALLFNIRLPINFDSPYKSLNIQEFWRRWHITLGRFLREYIYIPLGGNKQRVLLNLFVTFLIGGIWHGAGWTFVVWGALHGVAIVIHALWKRYNLPMYKVLAWFLTFNFINIAWVVFRAKTFGDALKVLKGMAGLTTLDMHGDMIAIGAHRYTLRMIGASLLIVFLAKNSNYLAERFRPTWASALFTALILTYALFDLSKVTQFIYFQF